MPSSLAGTKIREQKLSNGKITGAALGGKRIPVHAGGGTKNQTGTEKPATCSREMKSLTLSE
jgi:hypothetical protein